MTGVPILASWGAELHEAATACFVLELNTVLVFCCSFVRRKDNIVDHKRAKWDTKNAQEIICMKPFSHVF